MTVLCVDTGCICSAKHGGREGRGATIGVSMSNIALRKLTKKQTALVEAYVANGGNLTQASQEAGYAAGRQWKSYCTEEYEASPCATVHDGSGGEGV